MISLRQHAISLVAVFLALALGLFLGSGFVGDQVNSLTGAKRDRIGDLQEERDQLNAKLNSADSFDRAMAPRLIAQTLKGHSVLVVTVPGVVDADVDALKESVSAAGAGFAGQIEISEQLVADNEAAKLRSIIDQTIPVGAQLRADYVDSGSRAGDLLGTLTLHSADTRAAAAEDSRVGLEALREGGFIGYVDNAITPADLVLVITGGAYGGDSGAKGQLVGRLAAAMAARGQGGSLVGRIGSATGGSPIAIVRSDPALGNAISTVDNADVPTGRITSVLTLAEEGNARTGAYGTGPGATAITVGAR
ncbi:copper transporter [Gordonia sp. (in: high G+C Gram-positive bacteria)]|mgnify:CR=1 FL=1|jgi:hypothetical protein|uniref:copper transporter n=1 Tax=Gordonia sp. (in: high G+C Gram-positive bacteria) TaxID=84139 RepID=UPI001D487BAF|nr:copper transporter [Gordonia sp. (in: high G+C Gram-positive bacteria)]MCB1293346.1 copper transporter [Gordonia sp. (in: high G+C Gram-positive bacteria)]HMS77126.1 copper transporter [Gordonia sp. (in: high G+C Gram-positive bacteria)]HQV18175.1 copper transporter [Gordonia sp. (in: high G+C Gram-positive bacteria)]